MIKSKVLMLAGVLMGVVWMPLTLVAQEKPLRVAVIPKGTTHEFWKSIHAGAVKAQRELAEQGVRVEIIWKGPLKEDDRDQQIKVVESFIAQGVDGIVLAPLDDTALRRPVRDAVRRGIPVVIIDSDLQGEEWVSFVATDNYQGGVLAGRYLADLLRGQGKVAMLRYQEGSASTMNRERGFLDGIAQTPSVVVISENQYGGATSASAQDAAESLLQSLGGELSGVFTPNESTTFGMLRALQERGLAGKVKFVGFDASAKLVEALDAGEIDALTLQDPLRMGELGVRTMVDHLCGNPVPRRVDTGVKLVTPDNMNEPEQAALLNPPLEAYLP